MRRDFSKGFWHGRMVSVGHGLPKVSPGPAMPCEGATPETAGVARPQGGQPAAVFFPFGHPTPYANGFWSTFPFYSVYGSQRRTAWGVQGGRRRPQTAGPPAGCKL
jgi:hypothetical protein